MNIDGKLTSSWYTNPTDKGLIMNFHALVPEKYKRSIISGMVHRIFRACSSWDTFHKSIEKAKKILENNQYPSSFSDQIIKNCLASMLENEKEVS